MASQHFDTGLALPQRTAIRRALVAHLGTAPTGRGVPLLKSKGGYLAAIGQAPRALKGGSEDEIAILVAAFGGAAPTPALAVALGDQDFTRVGMGGTEELGELELAVYAVSAHQRSLVDGRLAPDAVAATDPTADPGIETMLEHVRELLCGRDLAIPSVHRIRPRSEREVATGADASIWEHRFTLGVDVSVNPERANSDVAGDLEVQSVLTP